MTTIAARPIKEKDRIASLDVLRGFALLGILPMNIQYFSMISAAYSNSDGLRGLARREPSGLAAVHGELLN